MSPAEKKKKKNDTLPTVPWVDEIRIKKYGAAGKLQKWI